MKKHILLSVFALIFFSCQPKKIAIAIDNADLTISINDTLTHEITIMGANARRLSWFSKEWTVDLMDLIVKTGNAYNAALQIVEQGTIQFRITIDTDIDTTILFKPVLEGEPASLYASIRYGTCAKLQEQETSSEDIIQTKSWLYDKNKPKPDSVVAKMSNIIRQLEQYDYKVLEPSEKIPVVKSLKGVSYGVSTNMEADYYYLFATACEDELDHFIKGVVANGFKGAEVNTSHDMTCFRYKYGVLGMFLIGVNKDWSKQIIPVGVVVVGSVLPKPKDAIGSLSYTIASLKTPNIIINSLKTKIVIPRNRPIVKESLDKRN